MITLRQMQIFTEVVRAGSFRRCGERLGMSQVAVSEHIRALEARWGILLFDRRPGAAPILTEAGRNAYDRIAVIIADIADLDIALTAGAPRGSHRLSVAMHSYMMRGLYGVLQTFETQSGVLVDLDLRIAPADDLVDRVARRDLDLAFVFTLDETDVPDGRLVGHEPLGIFVGPGHPLAGRQRVALTELVREPFVQLSERDPLRHLIIRAFAARGVSNLRIGLETDDFGLVVSYALYDQGYACLFTSSLAEPGAAHGLVQLQVDPPLPALEIRLISRRSAAHDKHLVALSDVILQRWQAPSES